MKKKTRRERVLSLLATREHFKSCKWLTQRIARMEKIHTYTNQRKYLSGSVASLLLRMVKAGEIEVDPIMKGSRGGKCYKLRTDHRDPLLREIDNYLKAWLPNTVHARVISMIKEACTKKS